MFPLFFHRNRMQPFRIQQSKTNFNRRITIRTIQMTICRRKPTIWIHCLQLVQINHQWATNRQKIIPLILKMQHHTIKVNTIRLRLFGSSIDSCSYWDTSIPVEKKWPNRHTDISRFANDSWSRKLVLASDRDGCQPFWVYKIIYSQFNSPRKFTSYAPKYLIKIFFFLMTY